MLVLIYLRYVSVKYKFDFIGVQETKKNRANFSDNFLKKLWISMLCLALVARSGGILCGINLESGLWTI